MNKIQVRAGLVLVFGLLVVLVIGNLPDESSTLVESELGSAPDSVRIGINSLPTNASVTTANAEVIRNEQTETATGDTLAGAVEATTSNPVVRTALVDSNYSYSFEVVEVAGTCPDCWATGNELRIKVFAQDLDTSDWVDLTTGGEGGLFVRQSSEDAGIEGVTVVVDLSTRVNTYESFDVVIEEV
jgi:hypothetical protein